MERFKRRTGRAPIIFTNLFFCTVYSSCTHRRIDCRPSICFPPPRDMSVPTTRKNTQATKTNEKKQSNTHIWADTRYLRTCDSNTGLKLQRTIFRIERGIAELPFFLSYLLDFYMESSFASISWKGGELGNKTYINIFL